MSNSTRSRTQRRSTRYLRMPDSVLNSVTQPDRRPSAEALQRAVAGIARKPGPGSPAAPPVRDRIFSGELRDITGAVLRHGPGQGRQTQTDSPTASPPHARGPAPLKPPPRAPKPWLKDSGTHAKRVEARHLPDDARRPWLKDAPGARPLAADESENRLPEVIIMEASEVDGAPEATRGHDAGVEWLLIDETIRRAEAAPAPVEAPTATPPLPVNPPAPKSPVARPAPAKPAPQPDSGAPVAPATGHSTGTSDAPGSSEIPAADADIESESAVASAESPIAATSSAVESPAELESRTTATENTSESPAAPTRAGVEQIVYAEAEPLFADPYSEPFVEPFVELPDFPEAEPIVETPAEVEQERIVVLPEEPEPERIVDIPDAALAGLFQKLQARDEQYVPGLIFEYEYEYIDDATGEPTASVPAAQPAAPPETPEPVVVEQVPEEAIPGAAAEDSPEPSEPRDTVPAPAAPPETPAPSPIAEAVAVPVIVTATAQTTPVDPGADAGGNDADSLKRELYAEIAGDVGPDLNAAPTDAADESPASGFDFEDDIDARIESELANATAAAKPQSPSVAAQPAPEPAGPFEDAVLLDDEELAEHILDSSSGHRISTIPSSAREQLDPAERNRLHDRLERAWKSTPPPVAVSETALLEQLRRLHTVPQPGADDFNELLEFLLEKTRANSLAVLMLDTAQMVYRPLLTAGLDRRTATNFYLGLDDAFLAGPPDFQVLRKSDHPAAMAHFKKRFASEFFHQMDGIYLMALKPYGVPGFLALVYEDLNFLTEHVLESMLPPILTDLLPALQRFATSVYEGERAGTDSENRGFEDTSIVDQLYRQLKEVSRGGRESIEVLHLSFPELLQTEPHWRVRLHEAAETLLRRLHADERLIEATPERITLILKSTQADALVAVMQDFAAEHGMQLRHRSLRYPEHSRNFFNYIAPGN